MKRVPPALRPHRPPKAAGTALPNALRLRAVAAALLAMLAGAFAPPLAAQQVPGDEEPLLPESISHDDVTMAGRYVRQWRQEDGTLTLLFNGGFEMTFGQRRLEARDAVVWIEPRRTELEGRKYFELTVYLSEQAVVREPGGTVTEDQTLLVSNIRTFGRITKSHDAHSPESMETSEFYQRAMADRERIERGVPPETAMPPVTVKRPADADRDRPPTIVRYDFPEGVEPAQTPAGEQVFIATGRVYLSQSGGPDSPVLEIMADHAVVFPAESAAEALLGDQEPTTRPATQPAEGEAGTPGQEDSSQEPPAVRPEQTPGLGQIGERIRAVYLEGDVVLSLGTRTVRANRLYYDFERSRAMILDGVFRAEIPDRTVPMYVRAAEIRQLSAREFAATQAMVSTSEFYTPHYHVGAEKVIVRDLTLRTAGGEAAGKLAGEYELHNSTLNVGGMPLMWWPYSSGRFEASETLIRRIRTGYSDDFGAEFETAWYLFNLLGITSPPGYDATLRLDYFTDRGPATGVDVDYLREDHFGLLRTYYINDGGEDNLGPLRDNTPASADRGRVLWRHRHYLPNDWELTLELSYISDPGFLEEYRRSEFNEGKEQETLVYLKRARDNEAITLLTNWRLLNFTTQTEHLPELAYRRIGDTFLDPFVNYLEGRVGTVRYRPDDRRFFDQRRLDNTAATDTTFRADGREELELPLKLGPVNLVPFASLRGSYWDGQPRDDGGLWRGLGVYGARGSTTFSKVYDEIESELLDIHRVRHIVKPDFAAWWSHSNTRSELITPFDEGIETIDDFYGVTFGLRQTWQTKRGNADDRRTVDVLRFDLEAGLFGGEVQAAEQSAGYANPLRPEDSRTRNYLAADVAWRLSDTTSILYDLNFDLNDGAVDRQNVSIAVERLPRLAYVFGWRSAGDIDMNVIGGGFNYKLNEKHIVTTRAWWDIDEGRLGEFSVAYVRKLPRWYFSVNLEIDEVFEDVKVSVAMWPEGIPEWTLGSRRFTGLGTSTGIRP